MAKIQLLGVVLFYSLMLQPSFAQNNWFTQGIKAIAGGNIASVTQVTLSDTKIGEGLKEALKIGIQNAVQKTGRVDGYYKNEAIKISIPDKLKTLEEGLRFIGMGKYLDDLVLSMNRSAEKAAPLASGIFIDAIFDMSIDDAQKLLNGSDTAATDYLKAKVSLKLKDAFRPIIKKSLEENQVVKKYNEVMGQYQGIPFAKKMPMFDPQEYVLNKALDGLFYVLGQEEANIRKNPQARVTDLLKQVFNKA